MYKETIIMIDKLAKFETADYGEIPEFPAKYGIPAITPKYAHPRVYVTKDTLPKIIKNLECDENIKVYHDLMDTANAVAEAKSLPESVDDIKQSINYLESVAFAYLITKDEKYGNAAILHTFNYLDSAVPKNGNPPVLPPSHGTAATFLHIVGEIYDWCYDLLTPALKKNLIAGACNFIAPAINIGCPPGGQGSVVGHGAESPLMRDWLAVALASYDEYPDIYNFVVGRILAEYTKAPNWYYRSGLQHQGSAYGTIPRLYPNMAADIMLHTATGARIFDVDFVPVVLTFINRIRPDGEQLRFGDDFNQSSLSGRYPMVMIGWTSFFAGSYYKNSIAKSWYRYLGSHISPGAGTLNKAIYLILNDPDVPSSDDMIYDLELVHYNPSPSGSMVARSAWGNKNAWMTYTNISEANAGNHNHKDAGIFQIYYKGILAPDTGMYEHDGQYYFSTLDCGYNKHTISKNGLLIYNPNHTDVGVWRYSGGQSMSKEEDRLAPMTFEEWTTFRRFTQAKVLGQSDALDEAGGLKYAYLGGDITRAYDADTVELVKRETISIDTKNPELPLLFAVHDRISSVSSDYKKSFVLHTMEEPVFNGGERIPAPEGSDPEFTYINGTDSFSYTNLRGPACAFSEEEVAEKYKGKYGGRLITKTLLPEEPTYRYIGGDGKRFWVNGSNPGSENPTKHPVGEIGWGRVEISPSTPRKTDSFLNLMCVTDAKDENGKYTTDRSVESTLICCETHEGAVCLGSCVMFGVSPERVSSPVSFTLEASGTLSYYVTGLCAGVWCVSVDGKEQSVKVTEQGGIAVFDAPAGNITLTMKV